MLFSLVGRLRITKLVPRRSLRSYQSNLQPSAALTVMGWSSSKLLTSIVTTFADVKILVGKVMGIVMGGVG